jgi:hypothetical protein
VRFAAKLKPHRPGITPALGLRADWDVVFHDIADPQELP